MVHFLQSYENKFYDGSFFCFIFIKSQNIIASRPVESKMLSDGRTGRFRAAADDPMPHGRPCRIDSLLISTGPALKRQILYVYLCR